LYGRDAWAELGCLLARPAAAVEVTDAAHLGDLLLWAHYPGGAAADGTFMPNQAIIET
jgi:hypothetical protein